MNLTNKWMNDPQYLAQIGHTLGGAWLLALPCFFLGHQVWHWAWLGIFAYAAVKEFFYDARYEVPKQTFGDNLMDFLFYQLGAGLGAGLVFLLAHLGRIR